MCMYDIHVHVSMCNWERWGQGIGTPGCLPYLSQAPRLSQLSAPRRQLLESTLFVIYHVRVFERSGTRKHASSENNDAL